MSLTRQEVLAADDLPRQEVQVPEWGGTVFVRVLSGTERDAFEQSVAGPRGGAMNLANVRARLVVLCATDASGERLFTDKDVVELGKKSAVALDRVFLAAQKLNGMTDADVEEMAENSGTDQSDDSTSS